MNAIWKNFGRLPSPALVLGALICSGCGRKAPPTSPPVVVRFQTARLAADSTAYRQARYVGILRGDRETDLSFRVPGILERIGPTNETEGWREATPIADRQSLALLNQTDFESAVTNAQAWTNVYDNAFQRTHKLFLEGTVSSQEDDLASAHRNSARADLRKAEQELADSHLRAPWPGVILARYASAGETVLAGRPVLRIADLSTNSLELGVPDTLINAIRPGDQLPVEVSGFAGRPFAGRVSEVGVAAKEGTRLFKVVLKIANDDPSRQLRAGMSATVDFGALQPPPTNAVVVPLSALVTSPRGGTNRLVVFVLDDAGVAREREVGTGDLIRSSVLVTGGLRAGERVATFGAANLADGLAVKALPENGFEGKP